ncbi:hypothetical protein M0804_004090 [Polistes exclamans]|nr:hypothetical protein M0804_004090 [Polistes exclamans]
MLKEDKEGEYIQVKIKDSNSSVVVVVVVVIVVMVVEYAVMVSSRVVLVILMVLVVEEVVEVVVEKRRCFREPRSTFNHLRSITSAEFSWRGTKRQRHIWNKNRSVLDVKRGEVDEGNVGGGTRVRKERIQKVGLIILRGCQRISTLVDNREQAGNRSGRSLTSFPAKWSRSLHQLKLWELAPGLRPDY